VVGKEETLGFLDTPLTMPEVGRQKSENRREHSRGLSKCETLFDPLAGIFSKQDVTQSLSDFEIAKLLFQSWN
jgi:hypothetical protein